MAKKAPDGIETYVVRGPYFDIVRKVQLVPEKAWGVLKQLRQKRSAPHCKVVAWFPDEMTAEALARRCIEVAAQRD